MMEHVIQVNSPTFPSDVKLGAQELLSQHPTVFLVNVFGSKVMDPGWYLLGRLWESHRIPLAGPFGWETEARAAWEASQLVHFDRELVPQHGLGFKAQNATIFEPTVLLRPENIQMAAGSRVDSFCKLEGGQGLVIGPYVHIASFAHIGIGGGLTILEEGSSCGSGSRILSGSNMPDAPSCSASAPAHLQRVERKVTRVGKNATVFAGATVLPGLTLGEGCRVGAGAVVTKDVPAFETWGGVPARRIKC